MVFRRTGEEAISYGMENEDMLVCLTADCIMFKVEESWLQDRDLPIPDAGGAA